MAPKLFLSFCLFATLAALVPAPPVNRGEALKAFLIQYGYLDGKSPSDEEFREALKEFQKTYKLEQTGEYSEDLEKFITGPRCGNPDKVKPGKGPLGYEVYAPWSKTNLKYKFLNNLRRGIDLDSSKVETIVDDAFKLWADAVSNRIQFTAVGKNDPSDLFIGFYKRKHIDPYPFDGPNGVLAHAFFPEVGHIHYDKDEPWSGNYANGINLESVSVHEIGHALGLLHSDVSDSIMYPYYTQPSGPVTLHQDDVDGINALYPPPSK